MRRLRAFTLIELLVVIAIIAILMAILMPALQRVKKQAKSVICQAHLKEWGPIWSMYCEDNRGFFPRRISGTCAKHQRELMQAIKRCMAWAPPTYSMSLDEWLREYTDNPAILGMFQNYLAAAGAIRNSELPAGEYFRMMKEIDASGRIWGYLPGGGGQLSDSLVKAIRRMGGEVWTGSPAMQIKVKDGVATGAVVRKGGATLFFTTFTFVREPMISFPCFSVAIFLISRRTEA